VTTEEMEIKLASHINQCQAFWHKIQQRNIWILQHHNGSRNTAHAGQWLCMMNQILSPSPTTTFSKSLGHLAIPNSQDLAQRLSFCICRTNPGVTKTLKEAFQVFPPADGLLWQMCVHVRAAMCR
jgi:hypothetical protein